MVKFKDISTLDFHPSLDMGNEDFLTHSINAMTIAKSLFGKLQSFDLENIYDFKFNNRLAISKNMVELDATLNNHTKLIELCLAFATTLNFIPVSHGYDFKIKNKHSLESVETIHLDFHGIPEILMPLHNLFRILDNKHPVFISLDSQTSFMSIDEVNSLFPYFQISKFGENPYTYHIGFTNLALLNNLNVLLLKPTTYLGYTMYKFLIQGKDSDSYPTKYFEKQVIKLDVAA